MVIYVRLAQGLVNRHGQWTCSTPTTLYQPTCQIQKAKTHIFILHNAINPTIGIFRGTLFRNPTKNSQAFRSELNSKQLLRLN